MSQLRTHLEPTARKQRMKNLIAVLVVLAASTVVAIWGAVDNDSGHSVSPMTAYAFIGVFAGLVGLVPNWRPHRGVAYLDDPSRIVWYYGVMKGGAVHAVMIGFDDGKLFRFPLPLISLKQGFSQEAFQLLRAEAPGATEGHSEDRRKAFKANPASLRKS